MTQSAEVFLGQYRRQQHGGGGPVQLGGELLGLEEGLLQL